MQDFIDFLARKEISIVLVILIIALAVYFILWFYSLLKKREVQKRLKNNTMELNKLVEQVREERQKLKQESFSNLREEKEIEVEKAKVEPKIERVIEPQVVVKEAFTTPLTVEAVVTKIEKKDEATPTANFLSFDEKYDSPVEIMDVEKTLKNKPLREEKEEVVVPPLKKEEPLEYKDEVYTKEEAKEELERITERLEKEEEEKNILLTAFENDQEENAIISLEELLEKGKTITQEEIVKYEDEGNEPITLQELEARYKEEQKQIVKEQEESLKPQVSLMDFSSAKLAPYKDEKSYQPTPIISPIFGIEEEHIARDTLLELENTANFEKLDEEIRKTNAFLSKIKELQKELD